MKKRKIDLKNDFKNSFENLNNVKLMQELDNGAKMYMMDLGGGDHAVFINPSLSYYYKESVGQYEPTFQKRYKLCEKSKRLCFCGKIA